MRTLYIECNMGAAGDMLTAALLELHPDKEDFLRRLNALELLGVRISAVPSVKCGVTGTHVTVTVHGEEEHSHDVTGDTPIGHSHAHSHDHVHEHAH
ncbi:MAG: LarC family nickel insertion protein, partial [Acutalibacter sp.]|nr:LarC family nickel insertion protein [Acutalibacter sp.]